MFDLHDLRADEVARGALTSWAALLRSQQYTGNEAVDLDADGVARTNVPIDALVQLARGEIVPRVLVGEALGTAHLEAFERVGLMEAVDDVVRSVARVFPMRSLMSLLPTSFEGHDVVYIGPDSVTLFEMVWKHGGIGTAACDLGTGNGFIAGALATRFDHVIAADLSARCVDTAALIPIMNPHVASRFSALRCDVAGGLRPGAFDVVSANTPWVPETIDRGARTDRVFAAGGPTGFELPRRFIDEAAALLRPGGRAFIACIDIAFEDGRRPLHDHLPAIRERGLDVEIVETTMNQKNDFTDWARKRVDGVRRAVHTVVVMRRGA